MATSQQGSYFSVSFRMIAVDRPLAYNLFINSSSLEERDRFVRVAPAGERLRREDVELFESKYRRVYVAEEERAAFLESLLEFAGAQASARTPLEQRRAVLSLFKDSAVERFEDLFASGGNTELLADALLGCKDVVEGMIDVLQDCTIEQLREHIASLSFHDFYTYDHSINVAMYCVVIYRMKNPGASRLDVLQAGLGGLLHDLGKIQIPTEILNKAGKLSDAEFAEIRNHPGYGCALLEQVRHNLPSGIDHGILSRVVHEHHENFDGSGYPSRCAGDGIHPLARITAIADFFDAITTKRSYHEPLSPEDALAMMAKAEGKKLDPALFQVFATQTRQKNSLRKLYVELPSDFDPCQPHEKLPFQKSVARGDSGPQGFGRIIRV